MTNIKAHAVRHDFLWAHGIEPDLDYVPRLKQARNLRDKIGQPKTEAWLWEYLLDGPE